MSKRQAFSCVVSGVEHSKSAICSLRVVTGYTMLCDGLILPTPIVYNANGDIVD